MKKVILILGMFLAGTSSRADFFDQRIYGPENELTSTYIYSITQDRDDFLWLGTDNGLFKYDGQKFTSFFLNDSLPDPVTTSFKNSKNLVYFGHQSGNILAWDGLAFKHFDLPKESVGSKINAIVESEDKSIWALTANKGFLKSSENSNEFVSIESNELKGIVAYCMGILNDILYVGTSEGLLRFDISNGALKPIAPVAELEYITILAIKVRNKNKGFWAGTADDGLYMVTAVGDKTGKIPDRAFKTEILPKNSIVSIDESSNRDLWLGTKLNGLYKINFNNDNSLPIQYSHFNAKNGFPGNQIGAILVDNEGTTWVGTMGNGLAQMIEKSLHYFPFKKSFGVSLVHTTIQNRNHEYFFGTNNGIIKGYYPDKSDSLKFIQYRSDIFAGMEITNIAYEIDSSFVIGTKAHGAFRSDEFLENVEPIELDLNFNVSPIRDIECDPDGNIWISMSGHGIFKFDKNGKLIQNYSTSTGFYHNEVYSIKSDRNGNIWTAAHSAGLAVIKIDGSIDLLTKDKIFPSRDINSITMDKDGDIWIATYGNGIFEYTGESFERFTKQEGLISDYCNSIVADFENHIWVGHRQGLSRLDKSTGSITNLTTKDGLGELNFLLGSVFSDIDHNIWMGNRKGVTYLSTPHKKFGYKQLVSHITDIKLFYKPIDLMQFTDKKSKVGSIPEGIKFEHNQHDVTFDYIAVNLRDPGKNLYRYKLVGYDNVWSPPVKQTSMTYTNLDPGKYTFEVRQSDNAVYWSEDNISRISFEVQPPYWEMWWFVTGELSFMAILVVITVVFTRKLRNKAVIKFAIYLCLFIIFEYVHTQLEPYLEGISGGAPIFQVLMHTLLALILFPVETFTTYYLMKRKKAEDLKAKAAQ